MLPCFRVDYGNPSGAHLMARAARPRRRRRPRHRRRSARRVVRPRSSSPAAAPKPTTWRARRGPPSRRCRRLLGHRAPRGARARRGDRRPNRSASTPRGVIDLDALEATLDDDGHDRVGDARQQRESAPCSRSVTWPRWCADAAPGACRCTPMRCRRSCWLDVAAECADVDLIAISAHKFGGPKGVGALVVRERRRARAAAARRGPGARAAQRHPQRGRHRRAWRPPRRHGRRPHAATIDRVGALRDRSPTGSARRCADLVESAVRHRRRPTAAHKVCRAIAHLCFDGVESEALLFLLDEAEGVPRRPRSSCASGAQEPVPRARRDGRRPRTWHRDRCACRSAGPRPPPTSITRSMRSPPPSLACACHGERP